MQVVANPNVDAVLVLACFLAVVVFRTVVGCACITYIGKICMWSKPVRAMRGSEVDHEHERVQAGARSRSKTQT